MRIIALALLFAASVAVAAEQTAFGVAGDPAKVARTVTIDMSDDMRYAPDALHVRVSDDGPGSQAEPGLGLTGMRERVHMVGGELTTTSDDGFVVEARLPA